MVFVFSVCEFQKCGYVVMTDEHFWNSQTEKTKTILTEAMRETTEWNEASAEKMNKDFVPFRRFSHRLR